MPSRSGSAPDGQANHLAQVGFHGIQGQSAQTVVAAEFDDDDRGSVPIERLGQARQSAARGIAANARVDHLVPVAFAFEPPT